MKFAAFIFDCDGTLVDSERIATEVIAEVAGEHGAFFDVDAAHKQFLGTRMADCITAIEAKLGGAKLPEDFAAESRRRMELRFTRDLKAVPGADELLRSIVLPLGVASNGPRNKTEANLRIVGLLQYFGEYIFSAYDIGHWKPKPDLFLHAARTMQVEPQACAVVEDSEPGVAAAVAAGMHVYALRNEHLNVTQSAQITPVDSLLHLKALLKHKD